MTRVRDITRAIQILLADDQPLVRTAVRNLLESNPRFRVCGEAATGKEAVRASGDLRSDVVILNISMPEMNGFDAARMIRSIHPHSAIVILSSHKNQQFEAEARRIGAPQKATQRLNLSTPLRMLKSKRDSRLG
jgi:two-component system, NarL family, response regulator LiaR